MRLLRFLPLFALVWMSQNFRTQNQVTAFINTLPEERQLEVRIVRHTNWVVFYRAES